MQCEYFTLADEEDDFGVVDATGRDATRRDEMWKAGLAMNMAEVLSEVKMIKTIVVVMLMFVIMLLLLLLLWTGNQRVG